jgi:hypothetical protein
MTTKVVYRLIQRLYHHPRGLKINHQRAPCPVSSPRATTGRNPSHRCSGLSPSTSSPPPQLASISVVVGPTPEGLRGFPLAGGALRQRARGCRGGSPGSHSSSGGGPRRRCLRRAEVAAGSAASSRAPGSFGRPDAIQSGSVPVWLLWWRHVGAAGSGGGRLKARGGGGKRRTSSSREHAGHPGAAPG